MNKQGGYECSECGALNLKPDELRHEDDFILENNNQIVSYCKVNICIDCINDHVFYRVENE